MSEFSDQDVAAIDPTRLIDEIARTLADLGTGSARQLPKRTLDLADGGFAMSIGAIVPRLGLAVSKWATYVPGDGVEGNSTSTLLVSDARTGDLRAVVRGLAATRLRTAATTAAIVQRCATTAPETVALLGFGPTNRSVLDLLRRVSPRLRDVRIVVRSRASVDRASHDLSARGLEVTVTSDAAAGLDGADLAVSATGAREPLAAVEDIAAGGLVVSLDGSSTWTRAAQTPALDDRTDESGGSSLARAFADDPPVRGVERLFVDCNGSAVTDAALAALLLGTRSLR